MTDENMSDIARRRRVVALGENILSSVDQIKADARELHQMDVSCDDLIDLVQRKASHDEIFMLTETRKGMQLDLAITNLGGYAAPLSELEKEQAALDATRDGVGEVLLMGDSSANRTKLAMFKRLLEEAPKLTDAMGRPVDGQAPAMEIAVVLRNFPHPIRGAASLTPEGMLQMLVPMETPGSARSFGGSFPQPPAVTMVEHFFHFEDVVAMVRERRVEMSGSTLSIA